MVPSFIVGDKEGMFKTMPTAGAAAAGAAVGAAAGGEDAAGGGGVVGGGDEAGTWMALMSSPSSATMAINSPI